MKKFLVLVLMMLAQVGLAQKTRAVQLDADTTTRPSVGMYGIGVRSNVPYLVANTGNTRRVAMFTDLNSKLNSPTTSTLNYLQKWNGLALANSQIFDNSTSVGIGTASPASKLHLLSTSSTVAMIESSASQAFYGLKSNTGGVVYFGNKNGGDFTIQTAGSGYSDKFYVTSAGGVGIGTTSPNEKLEVAESSGGRFILSDAGGASRRVLLIQSPRSGFDYARILGYNYGTSSPINLVLQDAGGNVGIGTPSPAEKLTVNGNIDLPFGANRYIKIGSSTNYFYNLQSVGDDFQILEAGSIPRFTIKYPSGNVGIGTPSPTVKAEIASDDAITALRVTTNNSGVSGSNYSEIQLADNGAVRSYWRQVRDGSGAVIFKYADHLRFYNSSNIERVRITDDGSLAIGNPTPAASAKLDITSTTQGVLLPRMTTTQINAIASPSNGLMVYNTTLNKLCVYEASAWRQVSTTAM